MNQFAGFSPVQNPSGIRWDNAGQVRTGQVVYGDDQNLIVMFYNRSVENPAKSASTNRPWYENQIYVRIQHPGENYNIIDRPASDEDKRRFRRHWELFVQNRTQVPEGTPIEMLFPNYPAVADTLRGFGVYTIEQCANLSAAAIDNIGRGGQEFVNKAKKYLESAEKGRGFQEQENEIRKLRQELKIANMHITTLKQNLDGYLLKNSGDPHGSLNPPYIPHYDPLVERINANHPTKEVQERALQLRDQELKRKTPRKRAVKLTADPSLTDPFANTETENATVGGDDTGNG